jgi:hypothetical protein
MGMRDYEYEEAVKYRYEYWERESWLQACLETLDKIGKGRGSSANYDMIDAVAMVAEKDVGREKIQSARENSREDELSPTEAYDSLKDGTLDVVWLKDYSETNYGTDDNPSYDYPVEDPDDILMMEDDGEFEGSDPVIILTNPGQGETGFDSASYYQLVRQAIKQRLDYTRQEIEDAEKVIEDY